MNNLYYFIISVISYLGVVAGFILMLVAPEEKKIGMRYFKLINYLLYVSLILLLIYLGEFNPYLIGLGIIGLVLFFVMKKYYIYIAYLLFSIVLYIFSEQNLEVFSIIIFAFGLSAGAYVTDLRHKKHSFYRILTLIYFIFITNLLKIIL